MEKDQMTPLETPLEPQQPEIPPRNIPQPDQKPPLPPEAMLTPPPRLQGNTNPQPVPQPRDAMPPLIPEIPAPEIPAPKLPAPEKPVMDTPSQEPPAAPVLTPPEPTVPNQYPEEGFRQPYIEGQKPFQPQYGGPTPPKEPVVYASDYERIMALPPISPQEAKSCRHSHEKRWYRRLIELNVLLIVFVLSLVVSHFTEYEDLTEEFTQHVFSGLFSDGDTDSDSSEAEKKKDGEKEQKKDADKDSEKDGNSSGKQSEKEKRAKEREKQREESEYMEDFAKYFPSELKMLLYGIAGFISLMITLYLQFASVKASSLKITQRNFPEIYSLVHSYAYRLGMKKVPEIYIVQQSGILNAFATYIFGRQYILIHTEVFEVAYREHKDMNALAFILAHEVSHIYYRHATFSYHLPILFSEGLPLVGAILSRTREYSCDRLAQRLTNYDGVQAIIMLMVDRHLYPMVDVQDYVDTTINERGFFLWLVNLLSSHPIMPKRIRALIQWNGSGELY